MKFIVERGKIMQQIQEELSHVWKGWTIEELIGEGSFGKVYRIVREEFGHTYGGLFCCDCATYCLFLSERGKVQVSIL